MIHLNVINFICSNFVNILYIAWTLKNNMRTDLSVNICLLFSSSTKIGAFFSMSSYSSTTIYHYCLFKMTFIFKKNWGFIFCVVWWYELTCKYVNNIINKFYNYQSTPLFLSIFRTVVIAITFLMYFDLSLSLMFVSFALLGGHFLYSYFLSIFFPCPWGRINDNIMQTQYQKNYPSASRYG